MKPKCLEIPLYLRILLDKTPDPFYKFKVHYGPGDVPWGTPTCTCNIYRRRTKEVSSHTIIDTKDNLKVSWRCLYKNYENLGVFIKLIKSKYVLFSTSLLMCAYIPSFIFYILKVPNVSLFGDEGKWHLVSSYISLQS